MFKLHWAQAHSTQTDLKKTRFLFHDQLHTNRIVKAVVDLRWGFSVVDKPAFRKLLQAFNSNKTIICRRTLSSIITSNRLNLARKVSDKLESALSVALTFDIWSVRKGARGFGCITAHYIKRKEAFIGAQFAFIAAGQQSTSEPLELAEDVDHRWSSALVLLERAFLLQKAIDRMLEHTKGMKTLEKIDWPTLDIVIQFLRPFQEETKRVCTASDISIPLVSFIVPRLVDHRVKFEKSSNNCIKDAAQSLRFKLTTNDCELYHPIVILAYVLDPKYKTKNLSDEMIKIVENQLKKLLDETQIPLSDSTTSTEDSVLCDQSDDEEPIDELETYLKTRREKRRSKAPIWWRNNADIYPKLSTVAQKILPLQATSVASERVFSVAGDIDTKARNRLSDERVESIVLFKSWMQFLNIE